LTTRLPSANRTRGLSVNYCSGFRALDVSSTSELGGMYRFLVYFYCIICALKRLLGHNVQVYKCIFFQSKLATLSLCQFLISELIILYYIIS